MDKLMKLYGDAANLNWVAGYFKNYAIAQINVAHRILEYLTPDNGYFEPRALDPETMECFVRGDVEGAVGRIMEEVKVDIDPESGMSEFIGEAVEFAGEELKEFNKRKEELSKEIPHKKVALSDDMLRCELKELGLGELLDG